MENNNNCCPDGCPPEGFCVGCKKRGQSASACFLSAVPIKEFADEILAKSLPPGLIRREKVGMQDFAEEILNKKGGL